jgi:PAS domain-containing protein
MATTGDCAVRRDQTSDFQLLINSTPTLIDTAKPDGYLEFFNQTWLSFVGQPVEDLAGWKWTAFIHTEDVEGIAELWRASFASGEPFRCEARVLRADVEYRWMVRPIAAALLPLIPRGGSGPFLSTNRTCWNQA